MKKILKIILIIVTIIIISGGFFVYNFRNDIPVIKDLIKNNYITEGKNKKEIKIESESDKIIPITSELGVVKKIVDNSNNIEIIYPVNNTEVKVGDTLEIKVHIADFNNLVSYMFLFQGESIFTNPTSPNIVYKFIVNGEYIENQSIGVVGNFYNGVKSFQSTVINNIKVTPIETIKKFNIEPEVMVMEKDESRKPDYEAIFPTAISQIGETDLFKVTIKDPSIISYDSKTNTFTSLKKGNTVAEVTYRGLSDHIFFEVLQPEIYQID